MPVPPTRWRMAALLTPLLLSVPVLSAAQSALRQDVVASGGTAMGSTNFRAVGTVGQPATGPVVGANTSASGGFWFDVDEVLTSVPEGPLRPRAFAMDQNYPNPFNPTTTIRYALPEESAVTLRVYDLSGRLVDELVDARQPAGTHRFDYDASSLGSGVYFYRIVAGAFVQTRKFALIK